MAESEFSLQEMEKSLNILLLGKTGHGKSATGNTLLREQVFLSKSGGKSVTQECQVFGNVVRGRHLTVVDTPGSMDTHDQDGALFNLIHAVLMLENMIDAVIIVLNYTTRMTTEEIECFEKLKVVFGDEVMRYIVVVFTHGDNYLKEKQRSKDGRSFKKFLAEDGEEYMQQFLADCDDRYILFDNYDDSDQQVTDLFQIIDKMMQSNQNKRYKSTLLERFYYDDVEDEHVDTNAVMSNVAEGEDEVGKKKGLKNPPSNINPSKSIEERRFRQARQAEEAKDKSPMEKPSLVMIQKEDIQDVVEEMKKAKEECFPGSAEVMVLSRGMVKMKDLKTGDKLLTFDEKMTLHDTEVYLFGHSCDMTKASFVNLKTRRKVISITEGHLIFTMTRENVFTKAARDVTVGDVLVTVDEEGRCVPEEVTEIWQSEEIGLYAPFTMSGSIVVDGVLASCYVDVVPHAVAHSLLWPVRQLYKMSPATLSVVSKPGEDGIPRWMRWCLDNVL